MRELGSLGRAFGRDEVLAGSMTGDAAHGMEQLAAPAAVDVHDLRRAFRLGLGPQGGEIVLDRVERPGVRPGEDLRHDRAGMDGRRVGDEPTKPFGADALGDRRERRTARRGQTGHAAVTVHATELVIKEPTAVGRRRRGVETLEARDERFGDQRGAGEQDGGPEDHAVSRTHFST